MDKQQALTTLNKVKAWINTTLKQYNSCLTVKDFDFARLSQYFSDQILRKTKVAIVDQCPVPPLEEYGVPDLAGSMLQNPDGMTWRDTFFVRHNAKNQEVIFFHELIHIIQWELLGEDRFMIAWAVAMLTYGYLSNPLETMAYRHQNIFINSNAPYDVALEIKSELELLPEYLFDITKIT